MDVTWEPLPGAVKKQTGEEPLPCRYGRFWLLALYPAVLGRPVVNSIQLLFRSYTHCTMKGRTVHRNPDVELCRHLQFHPHWWPRGVLLGKFPLCLSGSHLLEYFKSYTQIYWKKRQFTFQGNSYRLNLNDPRFWMLDLLVTQCCLESFWSLWEEARLAGGSSFPGWVLAYTENKI